MPLAPNVDNYLYGKGRIYFKPTGGSGYIHLGNVPKFELGIELTKVEHYSSMYGIKEKDLELITQKKCTTTLSMEEFSVQNMNLCFLGDTVQSASQAAAYIANTSVTPVADQFIDLGKKEVFVTKVSHGAVTGTAYALGETITGGTSSATGKVGWTESGLVELYDVDGTFVNGETITGGTGTGTSTITGVDVAEDVIVCDSGTATKRYVAGEDYTVDAVGGLLRKLTGGDITTTAYVTYDYPAKTLSSVRALASSTCRGEMLFIGDPDQGPKMHIQCWDVSLTISGSVGLISDDVASIPMTGEILSCATTHPTEPFFRASVIE